MERLQAKIVDAIKQDPDVSGAVSVIGASSINSTPNACHLAITLKSRDERSAFVSEVVDRLKRAVAGNGGLLPAGAGHPDQHENEPRSTSARCPAPIPRRWSTGR
jgi:multidrug efflux pump subunit AcrB